MMCHLVSLSAATYRTDSRNSRRTNGQCSLPYTSSMACPNPTGYRNGSVPLAYFQRPWACSNVDDHITVNTEKLSVATPDTANRTTRCCVLPVNIVSTREYKYRNAQYQQFFMFSMAALSTKISRRLLTARGSISPMLRRAAAP